MIFNLLLIKRSLSHNGNIPNVDGFDTQHILDVILAYNGTIKNALINLIKTIPAAYSLVIQYGDKIYILKMILDHYLMDLKVIHIYLQKQLD